MRAKKIERIAEIHRARNATDGAPNGGTSGIFSKPEQLYASLVGPLIGCYLPMSSSDIHEARINLNNSKLAKLWCAVYPESVVDEQIKKSGGFKLPLVNAL